MNENLLSWLSYGFSGCLGFVLGYFVYRVSNSSFKESCRLKAELGILQSQLLAQEVLVNNFYQESNRLLQDFKQAHQNSIRFRSLPSSPIGNQRPAPHQVSASFVDPSITGDFNHAFNLTKPVTKLTQGISTKSEEYPPVDYPLSSNWTNRMS